MKNHQPLGEVSYPVRQITGDKVMIELPDGKARFLYIHGSEIKFTDEQSSAVFDLFPQVKFASCGAPKTVEILKVILVNPAIL